MKCDSAAWNVIRVTDNIQIDDKPCSKICVRHFAQTQGSFREGAVSEADWGRVRNDEIQQNNTVTQAPSVTLSRATFLSEEGFKKQAFVHFDKYDKNIVLCQ